VVEKVQYLAIITSVPYPEPLERVHLTQGQSKLFENILINNGLAIVEGQVKPLKLL
jgi:hypothetical protein